MVSISLALATFNGERYIEQQFASLASQSLAPHELVICDDGSTDKTLEIAERFSKSAPFPVKVYRNPERLGYADNFLKAASLCSGQWIAFCDQDDIWHPQKLAIVSDIIARSPDVVLVSHPADLIDENGNSTGAVVWQSREVKYPRMSISPWRGGMGCGQVFRSALVHSIRYENRFLTNTATGRIAPHDDWILQLSQCIGAAYYLSDSLVFRRRHTASVTADAMPPTKILRRPLGDVVAPDLEEFSRLATNRAEILRLCALNTSPGFAISLRQSAEYFDLASAALFRRAQWRGYRGWNRYFSAAGVLAHAPFWKLGVGVLGWRGFVRDLHDLVKPS